MSAGLLRTLKFRSVTYQHRLIRCGKKNCERCPHGPYWYAFIALPNGRSSWRYIGKKLTGPVALFAEGKINE